MEGSFCQSSLWEHISFCSSCFSWNNDANIQIFVMVLINQFVLFNFFKLSFRLNEVGATEFATSIYISNISVL